MTNAGVPVLHQPFPEGKQVYLVDRKNVYSLPLKVWPGAMVQNRLQLELSGKEE